MLVQSTFYAMPAILLYDRFEHEPTKNYSSFSNPHQILTEETRYQTAPNII